MKSITVIALAAGACIASAQAPSGDTKTKLINLDTTSFPTKGGYSFKADSRFFGNEEDAVYGDLQLDFGLAENFDLALRGSFTKFRNYIVPKAFTIRHGGSDLEAMLKAKCPTMPGLMFGAGVSIPNTPAQQNAFFTAEALYGVTEQNVSFTIGPRGVFRKDSTLIGLGAGFDMKLGGGVSLVGDATGILTGHNTYSVNTAEARREWIYGLALSYQGRGFGSGYTLEAGITNGTGVTTGFSLTPSLGHSMGLYVGLTFHY